MQLTLNVLEHILNNMKKKPVNADNFAWNKSIEKLTSGDSTNVIKNTNPYNLSFLEALQKAMDEKLFIRSELMGPGIYLKLIDGILTVIDGNNFSQVLEPFQISLNSYTTNWKSFSVANPKAIFDRPGQFVVKNLDDKYMLLTGHEYGLYYTQKDIFGIPDFPYESGSKEDMEKSASIRNEKITKNLNLM